MCVKASLCFHIDEHVRASKPERVQTDEIWSFNCGKAKNVARAQSAPPGASVSFDEWRRIGSYLRLAMTTPPQPAIIPTWTPSPKRSTTHPNAYAGQRGWGSCAALCLHCFGSYRGSALPGEFNKRFSSGLVEAVWLSWIAPTPSLPRVGCLRSLIGRSFGYLTTTAQSVETCAFCSCRCRCRSQSPRPQPASCGVAAVYILPAIAESAGTISRVTCRVCARNVELRRNEVEIRCLWTGIDRGSG